MTGGAAAPGNASEDAMVAADEVRRALATGAFVPYFQPIVTLATGQPMGYEALARWRHPSRGLLRPGTFLPALEAAGLVVPFGWHILAVVCAQVAA